MRTDNLASHSVFCHTVFLALLPRIRLHADISFRYLRCPQRKEDAIAETVALCWKWLVELTRRGKDVQAFPSVLAAYAARAVKNGRRLCGQEKATDPMSPVTQPRRGFILTALPARSSLGSNAWDEALQDNTQSPIPEQVCFRCDFPEWRKCQSERNRRVLDELMLGERPQKVAQKFSLSAARISQLRREFKADWDRFCADSSGPRMHSQEQPPPREAQGPVNGCSARTCLLLRGSSPVLEKPARASR
jgi:hypothetical protein